MINITELPVWQELKRHYLDLSTCSLPALFAQDAERFRHYSLYAAGLMLDFSKHFITEKTLTLLTHLAEQCQFYEKRSALVSGKVVNLSEQRAARHMDLRAATPPVEVKAVWLRIEEAIKHVHMGVSRGFSNERFTDVISIGIGGSHVGPALASEFLAATQSTMLRCHFISNLDNHKLESLLAELQPQKTLVVLISKSFTTIETLTHGARIKEWLQSAGASAVQLQQHIWAVTAKPELAQSWGADASRIFPMWDWVGGRFSLWSAVGLVLALQFGMPIIQELWAGAREMDAHFVEAPLRYNMPVIMALLGVWYQHFFQATTQAVIPYLDTLQLLPTYLQQLHMESLGKRVSETGEAISWPTGQIIWGSCGTDSQHTYHQLLMQGTHFIPVDFIVGLDRRQPALFANCVAQAAVLMTGNPATSNEKIAQHAVIPGNQPSSMLVFNQQNAHTLGALLALYEHKVFVQSVIWQINAFDQWGVEQGKRLAHAMQDFLQTGEWKNTLALDGSSQGLLNLFKTNQQAEEKINV